jgi:predicted nucleic acid-binding protein
MTLEVGNVIAKKIRRAELTRHDGETILKELRHLPLQRHADDRLFPAAYELALDTHRSLYDCLYLALAEAVDGALVTADRKFYTAITNGPYGRRISWVEDLPQLA